MKTKRLETDMLIIGGGTILMSNVDFRFLSTFGLTDSSFEF